MSAPSYRVDVRDILDDLAATVTVDVDIEVPAVVLGYEKYPARGPAHVAVTLTNTGSGIVLAGSVDLMVTAVCSRCLEEFSLSISSEVDGFYIHHGREHELPEEQEFLFIDEGSVDIMEPVLSAIVLAMPFAPVHAEDCPGICVSCGRDLSEGDCSCGPDLSSSPFAALKDLLPPEDPG
ncbi:MAG: DUF177 domain-containing protein [Coriobacteriia bacterium]|nr:DUF177 domain-containing protein [Coriobacteriia bacterium]